MVTSATVIAGKIFAALVVPHELLVCCCAKDGFLQLVHACSRAGNICQYPYQQCRSRVYRYVTNLDTVKPLNNNNAYSNILVVTTTFEGTFLAALEIAWI